MDSFQLNVFRDRHGNWRASTNKGRGKSHSIKLGPVEALQLQSIAMCALEAKSQPPVTE